MYGENKVTLKITKNPYNFADMRHESVVVKHNHKFPRIRQQLFQIK